MYKACGEQVDGKECNKKVVENGDGTFRCEKCAKDKNDYKWRIMLQLNMADASDNTWASCFQETAEKLLKVDSATLGQYHEHDEEQYNAVFLDSTFKTFNFRMRVKADTYNDETRLKHTVLSPTILSLIYIIFVHKIVSADEIDWSEYCKKMINEIESMGGTLPDKVDTSPYI